MVSGGRAASDTRGQSSVPAPAMRRRERRRSRRERDYSRPCPARRSFRAALAGLLTARAGACAVGASGSREPRARRPTSGDPLARAPRLDHPGAAAQRRRQRSPAPSPTPATRPGPAINLHAFSSHVPDPRRAPLAVSAAAEPDEPRRRADRRRPAPTTPSTSSRPASPRTSADSVPRRAARRSPTAGVYWIGVHALGDSRRCPRDDVRRRSRAHLHPAGARAGRRDAGDAVILVRSASRSGTPPTAGSAGVDRWATSPGRGRPPRRRARHGRRRAGATPYTWLVDPAVLARRRRGWPAATRRAASAPDPDRARPGADRPPRSPSDDARTPSAARSRRRRPHRRARRRPDAPTEEEPRAAAAGDVARRASSALVGTGRPVLTLPYGDLDVSAAVRTARTTTTRPWPAAPR